MSSEVADNDGDLYDCLPDTFVQEGSVLLPFDPQEIIENLQRERYATQSRETGKVSHAVVYQLYYMLRPYLNVRMRKHLQRWKLRGWQELTFPEWPRRYDG